jgi:hypothetical protein
MSASIHALERWRSFVDNQAWARGSLDQSSYLTFIRAGSLGIAPEEAIETVAARIKAAGDHPRQAKLNQQLRRAYGFASASHHPHGCYHVHKEMRPAFAPDYARKFAERIPASVDQAWLRKRSPVKVPYLLTPAEFLSAAYQMGDQVLIFTDYRSQGQMLWQRYAFKVERDELDSFVRGHADGVWILSNPVDGKEHFNERQQKMSRRSEESITAFRYAVLESDCQPPEQWLRILVQLPLPIVSITSSGGKSLHALIRVDASSKLNWDQTIGAIKPRLINLGADPGALTAVRLTRLPNCYRGERFQELLYLDPTPTDDPIWRAANGS